MAYYLTKTILRVIGLMTIIQSALGVRGQSILKAPSESRVLDFGSGARLGEVCVRKWGLIDVPDTLGFQDAKGKIAVPADSQVEFSYSARCDEQWGDAPLQDYRFDPDVLRRLGPDAIQFLHFAYLNDSTIPFEKVLQCFARQETLFGIQLIDCDVTSKDLSILNTHPSIRAIYLNRVTSWMPFAGLHDLPNLERIEIERGNHDRLFDGLDKLRTLKSLKLSVLMYMNDSDLDELKNLGQLKQLEMIYLRNITSAGLQNLRGLKLLEDLTLDEMGPVETDDLGFLNDLPSLKRLRLSDNTTVSDAAISTVIGLSKLTLLDLTQSHVSKASMDRLERARPHLTISGATAD